MSKVVRGVLIVAVIAAVVGGVIWFRRRNAAEAAEEQEILRTAEVTRGTLDLAVAASGNVVARRSADLRFETTGTVAAVTVEVGDHVAAGDVLARLKDDSLQDAVRQAQLAVEEAEVSLAMTLEPADEADVRLAQLAIQEASQAMAVAKASEELARARAGQQQEQAQELAEEARSAYEGYLDLLDEYGLPTAYAAPVTAAYMEAEGNVGVTQVQNEHAIQQARSQWSAAHQRYQQAARDLEQLREGPDEDQIRRLELGLERAQLRLAQAEADLDAVTLTAPFAGLVSAVNVQAGAPAPATMPVVSLLDDGAYFVELMVDEIDIGAVREGQPVEITLDAYPDAVLEGEVETIGALPDTPDGAAGLSSIETVIAYPVRVRLEAYDGAEVRDGLTASATILTDRREDVLLVPTWAIRTDQTSTATYTYCYCVADGEPRRVNVELGARGETHTEVLSGLNEGDTVALVTESRNILEFEGPPSQGGF